MSFQRISDHRVDAVREEGGDGGALTSRSPSFSSRWISTRCGREVGAVAQPAQRRGDLLGARDEHVGDLLRLLHRRLDAVEHELVGGLLGVVDDVVERAGERVHVGGVERARGGRARCPRGGAGCRGRSGRPPARRAGCRGRARPARGSPPAGRAAAAQQRWTLRAGLLEQREQLGVRLRLRWPHAATNVAARGAVSPGRSQPFHGPFTMTVTESARRAQAACSADGVDARRRGAAGRGSGGPAGRPPRAGREVARCRSRCGSSSCSRRCCAGRAGSCRARSSTATVWGAPLRASDRSVDVYVHKLRAKLARVQPEYRYIHTHFGFGYRLRAGAFTPLSHGRDTTDEQDGLPMRKNGTCWCSPSRARWRSASPPAATTTTRHRRGGTTGDVRRRRRRQRHDRDRRLVDRRAVRRGRGRAVQRGEPRREDHRRHVRHRRRLREVLRRRDRHLRRLAPDRRGGGGAASARRAASKYTEIVRSPTTASPWRRTRTSPSTA